MICGDVDLRLAFPGLTRNQPIWCADRVGRTVEMMRAVRCGACRVSRAIVSKAATIRPSPTRTAISAPNSTWTEGMPRRVAALSKHGRSSCTREAQCSSSIAVAEAVATPRIPVAAGQGNGEAQPWADTGAPGEDRINAARLPVSAGNCLRWHIGWQSASRFRCAPTDPWGRSLILVWMSTYIDGKLSI